MRINATTVQESSYHAHNPADNDCVLSFVSLLLFLFLFLKCRILSRFASFSSRWDSSTSASARATSSAQNERTRHKHRPNKAAASATQSEPSAHSSSQSHRSTSHPNSNSDSSSHRSTHRSRAHRAEVEAIENARHAVKPSMKSSNPRERISALRTLLEEARRSGKPVKIPVMTSYRPSKRINHTATTSSDATISTRSSLNTPDAHRNEVDEADDAVFPDPAKMSITRSQAASISQRQHKSQTHSGARSELKRNRRAQS